MNRRMTGSDSFGRIYKEAIMAYFKAISQNLLGEAEKNHKKPELASGLRF
jgi:hypothetical protein